MPFTIVEGQVVITSDDGSYQLVIDSNGQIGAVLNVNGSPVDPRNIRALTSSDIISAVQSGVWNIADITGIISLPTGASTEAKQDSVVSELQDIEADIESVDISIQASQPRKLQDGDGNAITSTDLGGGKRGIDISGSMSVSPDSRFNFDANGNLKVVNKLEVPVGTTPVNIVYYGEHNNTEWIEYEIPIGKRFTLQYMTFGAHRSTQGSRVELRDRGLSDNDWILITTPIFSNGESIQEILNISIEASTSSSRWVEMVVINTQNRYAGSEVFGYLEDL